MMEDELLMDEFEIEDNNDNQSLFLNIKPENQEEDKLTNINNNTNQELLNLDTATSQFTLTCLNELYTGLIKIKNNMNSIQSLILNFFQSGSPQIVQQLNSIFPSIFNTLTTDFNYLQYIDTNCLLNPIEMERFDYLKQELGNELTQAELYQQEFQSISSNSPINA
jgi:hypothetical protein